MKKQSSFVPDLFIKQAINRETKRKSGNRLSLDPANPGFQRIMESCIDMTLKRSIDTIER